MCRSQLSRIVSTHGIERVESLRSREYKRVVIYIEVIYKISRGWRCMRIANNKIPGVVEQDAAIYG